MRIFLHIQKTAGSSLREALAGLLPADRTVLVYPSLVGKTVHEYLAMSVEQRNRFDYVIGHLYFGVHNFISRPSTYITFVREPLDRIRSQYYQYMKHPPEYRVLGRRVPLSCLVEYGLIEEFDNYQTRVLSGMATDRVPLGEMTTEHVELAFRNIRDRFEFVGRFENLDQDWPALTSLLGFGQVQLGRHNISHDKHALAEDSDFRRLRWQFVAENNRLDTLLYEAIGRLPSPIVRQAEAARPEAALARAAT